MKKPLHLLVALTAILSPGMRASSAAAKPVAFVQDEFVIGLWVAPQASNSYYQDLAGANFNLVVGGDLDLSKKYGLHALANISGPVEKWPQNSACWGYLLVDEPGAGSFPAIAKQAADVRAAHPGCFGYVNLLPNYAGPGVLGTPTYDEYVAKFVREVKPEVLSMDFYPLMRPEGDSRADYRANLECFRTNALAAGIPFWNYFYSMPFNDRLDPTEAQIRWQIFTSIAYGAKGVLYFCYYTPGKGAAGRGEFPKGGAIITAEGFRTRHYGEAQRINAELKNYGPTLLKLSSTGVHYLTIKTNSGDILAGQAVRKISAIPGDPPANYLVGTFRQADGTRAVVLVNDSYSQTGWLTVDFDAPEGSVMEVSKTDGTISPVRDDSPELKGLQISLGAGDGRLYILPATTNGHGL